MRGPQPATELGAGDVTNSELPAWLVPNAVATVLKALAAVPTADLYRMTAVLRSASRNARADGVVFADPLRGLADLVSAVESRTDVAECWAASIRRDLDRRGADWAPPDVPTW